MEERGDCGNCDNCSDDGTRECDPESTVTAQKILSCCIRLQERYGAVYLVKVLRGETDNVQPYHYELSTFGLLSDVPATQVRRWVDECVVLDLLYRSEGEYPVLKVSSAGWQVLRGQREVELTKAAARGGDRKKEKKDRIKKHGAHAALDLGDDESLLFEKLRAMRLRLAREQNVAAYMVFTDATLYAIAREQPESLEELEQVPGVGVRKLDDYGEEVINVVTEWKSGGS